MAYVKKEDGRYSIWKPGTKTLIGEGDDKTQPDYRGEITNGKPHGQGTLTLPKGDKYVGEFRNGKFNGQGTYILSNGDEYVGGWNDSKYHGQGTYTWSDGRKYVGAWKDDELYVGITYDKDGKRRRRRRRGNIQTRTHTLLTN